MNKSIIITSTGRSGTTFLIILYTLLGFNTGFNTGFEQDCFHKYLYKGCNSGMERDAKSIGKFEIVKNPKFLNTMDKIEHNKILYCVIPIRNFEHSAKSREYYKNLEGGLIDNAKDYKEQIVLYNKYIANYIQYMVLKELPTIFIDFEKMVTDCNYLYEKLKPTFSINTDVNINKDVFNMCYKRASELQSKRTII